VSVATLTTLVTAIATLIAAITAAVGTALNHGKLTDVKADTQQIKNGGVPNASGATGTTANGPNSGGNIPGNA
jgi:hypothetical protein